MDPVAEVGPCSRGVIPPAETVGAHVQSRQRFQAFARRWLLLLLTVVIAPTIVGLDVGRAPTYAAGNTSFNVCVLMYDVHLNSDGGPPKSAAETTAGGSGHNGDNSLQKNTGTPLGNGCFVKTFPSLTTQASGNVQLGGSISDTATLSGGNSPTGSITFDLFSDVFCSNKVTTLNATASVNGNGSYTSTQYQPSQPGTYYWI